MAVHADGSNISSDHFDHNDNILHEHKCLKCAELEWQPKETLTELSSLQLIIKLLYKEISSVSSSKQPSLEHNETARIFSRLYKRNNELETKKNPAIKHHSVSSFQHPLEFNPNRVRCKVM